VRDSILTILPTKRFEDIRSAAGKTMLRDQMLERINSLLARGQLTNIYFKEFVVQ
jgi:flagellar FliL protein